MTTEHYAAGDDGTFVSASDQILRTEPRIPLAHRLPDFC